MYVVPRNNEPRSRVPTQPTHKKASCDLPILLNLFFQFHGLLITIVDMRPRLLIPFLSVGPAVLTAAVTGLEPRGLAARDVEILNTRNLDQLSSQEFEILKRSLTERDLLNDIWGKVKDATTCAGGQVSVTTRGGINSCT